MIPRFRLVSLSHSRSYGSVLGLGESCAASKSSLGCRLIQMTLCSYLISSFHEKLYNRGSAHTTLLALGAPPRH